MNYKVIEGSENWYETIPDEYAITCVEQYRSTKDERDRILKFRFVLPTHKQNITGYTEMYGIITVPADTEGIIISKNSTVGMPDVYFRNDNEISYGGRLIKTNIKPVYNPPRFYKVYHYSARITGKQKSDNDAPSWLKRFSKLFCANIAYFEF